MKWLAESTNRKYANTRKAEGETREQAVEIFFEQYPTENECSSGYGYKGSSDIRWHLRPGYFRGVLTNKVYKEQKF